MACSKRRVLVCIACASEPCNAIDTLCRNHVHNKLTEGLDLAYSLDADVAPSTKYQSDKAPYVSKAKDTNFDPDSGFPSFTPHPWQRRDTV